MKKSINIFFIAIRLVLGGVMIYGGLSKFKKSMPSPTEMLIMDDQKKTEYLKNPEKLKIKNYIFGMKQSGFAWELLGITEIIGGLLLISQFFSFIGALILLPVSLHIFLFHLKLEPSDTKELVLALLYLLINLLLLLKEYRLFKPLLKLKIWTH